MNKIRLYSLALASLITCTVGAQVLWYDTSAEDWMQSLPIGNGRIGAQIWGQAGKETVSINESSMWSGWYNPDQSKPFGKEKLAEVRSLFFKGKIAQANSICFESLQGNESGFGTHLPLGDIVVTHYYNSGSANDAKDYRRQLDMKDAVASVEYSINDVMYTNRYISSNPADVIAVNYKASKGGMISFDINASLLRKQASVRTEGESLIIEGVCRKDNEHKGGVNFYCRVSINHKGGKVSTAYGMLSLENADEATLIIDLRTDYKREQYKYECNSAVENAMSRDFADILKEHSADFSRLFSRVDIQLGIDDKADIPTDKRWKNVRNGGDDTGLQTLFFQYGRYLTASLSRENSPLPIALQGFFNDNRACSMAWNNDYHLDINTQQNYWLANVGNLAECNAPLYTYLADLTRYGNDMVKIVYGVDKGWTAHTTANIWGFTSPSGSVWWGLHPTGGSWMATHLWEDYTFTHDINVLRKGYPILKGNAEFLYEYMVKDPRNGYLVTGPSISPENSYGSTEGNWPAAMMPTVDRVMVWEIFNACIESSKILNTDKSFASQLAKALKQLPPYRKNKYGGLREWLDDYDDINVNHRHTSHLLALYPYSQLSLQKTPELCESAYNSLTRRMSAKDWEDVEWSRANAICYSARLHHAEEAYKSINMLIGKLGRENLLTVSPKGIAGAPFDVFSFDGNPAGAAGIAEMLIQSHEGYVEYLPVLPKQWAEGHFQGLCVRGGAETSAIWNNNKITMATLKATKDGRFLVKIPSEVSIVMLNGKSIKIKKDARGCMAFSLKSNDLIEMK